MKVFNKLVFFFLLFLVLYTTKAYTQQPILQSVKYDSIIGFVVMDKNYNTYHAGSYFNPNTAIRSWQISKLDRNQNHIWTFDYQRYLNRSGSPLSLVVDDSCNVYVTGYYEASSVKTEAITMKLDSNGINKWTVVEPNTGFYIDQAKKICIDKEGFLYVGGSTTRFGQDADIFLIKFNGAGERLWKKIYNTPGSSGDQGDFYKNMAIDSIGNSYIAYYTVNGSQPGKASLLKYDKNGNLKFTYEDFSFFQSTSINLTVFKNKDVYVCGQTWDSTNDNSKFIVYKFDSAGSISWKRQFTKGAGFDNEAEEIICDTTGSVYIGGRSNSYYGYFITLIKYKQDGALDWTRYKTGDIITYPQYFWGLKSDKLDNVYLLGSLFNQSTSLDGIISKYDHNGNEIWNITYNQKDTTTEEIQYVFFLNNNNFLLIGGYQFGIPTNNIIVFFHYSQVVGIYSNGISLPNKFELSQNYPNPFNPQTKVKFKITEKNDYSIKLYDMLGKKLIEVTYNNLASGSYEYTFNLNNFGSGTYFYELSSPKEKIVKQMLFIK